MPSFFAPIHAEMVVGIWSTLSRNGVIPASWSLAHISRNSSQVSGTASYPTSASSSLL